MSLKEKIFKSKRRLILILLSLFLAYFGFYNFSSYVPLKPASNNSLEGFICSNETKTLTQEEKKTREKRKKEIEKALGKTTGLHASFGAHTFFTISLNHPKPSKLYSMQSKMSMEDWELLSEIFIENFDKWRDGKNKRLQSTQNLFAIRGAEAIAILECKANDIPMLTKLYDKIFNDWSGIQGIKDLSELPSFKSEYQESVFVEVFITLSKLLLVAFMLSMPIVFIGSIIVGVIKAHRGTLDDF